MSGPTLTLEEARQAIESLTTADLLRVERMGRLYALRLGCEVRELLHDAVCLALSGTRKCPVDLPMAHHLVGVMRSLSSHRRATANRGPEIVALDATGTDGGSIRNVASSERNAEEGCLAREDIVLRQRALEELFVDDEKAMLFVWAQLDEIPKEEIKAMNELDDTAYDSIRRRVRRKIDGRFPDGWTS